MMSMIKKLHKWLSLLVALQLFIWLGTGLFFNLMDHEKASGNQYRQSLQVAAIEQARLIEPSLVLASAQPVVSIRLISLLAEPYYLLTHQQGLYRHLKSEYSLVHAYTGARVRITELMAAEIAQASYSGAGQIISVVKLSPPYQDIPKEKNQVWQVNFADQINTSVYVDSQSGRIVSHSNDDKRFVDFFFILHFMDYGNTGSFNNIQVIVFGLLTMLFCLTGFIWTVDLARHGQFNFSVSRQKRQLILLNKSQHTIAKFEVSKRVNLLDALNQQDIALPSSCGGGGSCGQCKVKLKTSSKITSAEQAHFNNQQLKQGYRLACQHNAGEIEQLSLLNDVALAKKHLLELSHSEFISPFIKELRFKVVGGYRLRYKAGAHMRFFIPAANGVSIPQRLPEALKPHWQEIALLQYQHKACSRHYSLACGKGQVDGGTNELVFTIKIQNAANNSVLPGIGSSYLCNLTPGQTISAVGPFEAFYAQPASNKTMVLIGAGSGMAPLKAIIEEQLSAAQVSKCKLREIHFLYGARTRQDLLYQAHFLQLSQQYQQFYYYPVLSNPDPQWQADKGYVQALLATQLHTIFDVSHTEFYLCGPAAMMTTAMEILIENGVDASNIAFDKFS
ncbi:NADH:ubiquinone oxidoreductase, Na(+)-translocating, F subunit [Colwellia chukchiensis]|uniref:NADH:ubiquinone oxidoreductase, Na(+)-translocating, F subunit n=1 Tax=Colwellia chukchiensis TaxID=641665 RepID=A0A1H7NDZ1_9GAMM|nr:2Fe-2S iron-sulfur cluster-binding protein [Colwellia chukchiensis]SEL21205.1 NADH:ubiquinone oxidoreductase, Na(+)-translocating, F subunit [Colwellia chukchiensis]